VASKVVSIRPAAQPPDEATRKQKLDRYGEIIRILKLTAPLEDEKSVLSAEIQGWHKDDAGDVPVIDRGHLYEIQLSPRRNERTIFSKLKAWNALKKALGLHGLIALINIPMGEVLDKHIPKSAQKAFVSEERSGYRTLTVVALHPASPEDYSEAA
jgi:hypothetical protein